MEYLSQTLRLKEAEIRYLNELQISFKDTIDEVSQNYPKDAQKSIALDMFADERSDRDKWAEKGVPYRVQDYLHETLIDLWSRTQILGTATEEEEKEFVDGKSRDLGVLAIKIGQERKGFRDYFR